MKPIAFAFVLAALFVRGDNRTSIAATACGSDCSGMVVPAGAVAMICPAGDTPTFGDQGITLSLPFGAPVPEQRIYAMEACDNLTFCVAPQIDGPPDAGGTATFTGLLAGGGSTDGWLWATGQIPEPPCIVVEAPVRIVSPDISGDLVVDLTDLAVLAMAWYPAPYDPRADFDGDSDVDLVDLYLFSLHMGHSCN